MDLQKVKEFLLEKEERAKKSRDEKRREVFARLDGAAGLFSKYAIERVYLYGSMVTGAIHHKSDVDIAIEGDPGFKNILRLYSELSGVLSMPVDVRLLDELPFREAVKKRGKVIYERKVVPPQE